MGVPPGMAIGMLGINRVRVTARMREGRIEHAGLAGAFAMIRAATSAKSNKPNRLVRTGKSCSLSLPPPSLLSREFAMSRQTRPCCSGVSRRSFLTNTGMGFTGLALAAMMGKDRVARAESTGIANHRPDRKSTRLNSSHIQKSRMPSSA